MEENKKRISPILIAILVLFGSCLLGAGLWYGLNYFKEAEKPSNQPEPSNTTEPQEQQNNPVGERIDFPQKSDEKYFLLNGFYELLSIDEFKTNFKNLKKEKNGNTFVYNCEEYLDKYSICNRISLKINNEVSIEQWFAKGFDYSEPDVNEFINDSFNYLKDKGSKYYKVNNYYIFYDYVGGGVDLNTITIYDKSKEVYKNNLVKTQYWLNENAYDSISAAPVVTSNTLHFIQQTPDFSLDKVLYNTIDLSKDKIVVNLVKEFTGYVSGEK